MNLLYLIFCLFLPVTLFAQQKKLINTDRPDQTEGTYVLDPGVVQLETGLVYTRFVTRGHAVIAQGMVRYGVCKRVEARLFIEDGYNRDRYMSETVESTYPLAASAKFRILQQDNWVPDITLVGYLKLPLTAHTSAQKHYWSPMLLLAFQNSITSDWIVEYNIGVMEETESADYNWVVNASTRYTILDQLQIFAEYFAQYSDAKPPFHNADAGILYILRKNIQLDVSAGSSLAAEQPNQFVTAGLSFRIE